MTDQAIVPFKAGELERVNELEERMVQFLPGAKDVPHEIRLAMAQIAIAHGLDPWLKEVWPIPVKKNGQIVGWELMIGISGWRNSAHRSNEYWGRRFEKVSDEERKWLAAGPNDLVVRCIVMRRKTGQQPAEFDGYGVARPDELSKMNKFQLARLRAERDAMKAAFPISAPIGVTLTTTDDDGGSINGDHGPDLPSLSRYDAGAAPSEIIEHGRHELGHDEGDLTGNYIEVKPVVYPIRAETVTTAARAGELDQSAGAWVTSSPEPAAENGKNGDGALPATKAEFEAWLKVHHINGQETHSVLGTDAASWLKMNAGKTWADVAQTIATTLGK